MSRIRLEWNVESQKIDKSDSEDPLAKRARRRRTLRLIMLIGTVLAALVITALVIRQRLFDIQGQLEQLLRETVQAETAALRIGDFNTFFAVQDSASETWQRQQQAIFREYSELKAKYDVDLTGKILDLEIDGQRGRVVVEEIFNGIRYAEVWFYRSSGQGWRHVAPDFSFWGEEKTLESNWLSIRYYDLDERFAQSLNAIVGEWLRKECEIVTCAAGFSLSIEVVNMAAAPVSWSDEGDATLRILSPLAAGRMFIDEPFDSSLQKLVAAELTQR